MKPRGILPNNFIAYRITNKVTGKSYIGITQRSLEERWNAHCYQCKGRIGLSIKKWGKDCFVIKQIASAKSIEDLMLIERTLVEQENTIVPFGYNLHLGGEGVFCPSEITRKRMSDAAKKRVGRFVSEETRNKISTSLKGHGFKPETLEKMRLSKLGTKASEATRKKLSEQRTGRKMPPRSKEWCENMSRIKKENGQKPLPCTEETRIKLRNATKKRWENPEYKERVGKLISAGRLGVRHKV